MTLSSESAAPPVDMTQPPLGAPSYGVDMKTAVKRFWKKYATFSGRASLSEYWMAILFNALVYMVLLALLYTALFLGSSVDEFGDTSPGPFFPIFPFLVLGWYLATLIPTLAITWRRLHDTGRSGGFYFLQCIPFVGGIIVLVLLALPSEPSGIRFDRVEQKRR